MEKLNKLQASIKIKQIIKNNATKDVSIAEIDTDQYLDYVETIFSEIDWSTASWVDRIKAILSIGDIVVEFYKDIIDENSNDREQAFVDLSLIGWSYAKQKFNISLPIFISAFENKIIETIVRSSIKFIVSKMDR